MPTLNIAINVDGKPAKRVYVEHTWEVLGIRGSLGLYMTDNNGRVRDNGGNAGIDSSKDEAHIRILGQNSVARILNGKFPLMIFPIWVDKKVRDGVTINLNTAADKVDHFRILNLAMQNYEEVHRRFPPFSSLPNVDFPLGRQRTLQATKGQTERIGIVFPDNLFSDNPSDALAFCEPKSLTTGYPLIHLKDRNQSQPMFDKLFGTNGMSPTVIAGEFSHALHFSLLDSTARGAVEVNYVKFLLSEWLADRKPIHKMGKHTTALVAYIEAIDHFSLRLSLFVARFGNFRVDLPRDFVLAELKDTAPYWLAGSPQVGQLTGDNMRPLFTTSDDEGAIYGAIFLDFARRTTPATAVWAYFQSHALNFRQYQSWIHAHMPQHTAAIDAVAVTWSL